jgi:N-acetylmuramoyl-L-alanine amidase
MGSLENPNVETNSGLPVTELDIKRRELLLKERQFELELKSKKYSFSPAMTTIIAAIIGIVASVITASMTGYQNIKLERLKQEFQIIKTASENLTQEEAAKNLLFFVDIGILRDETGKIREYANAGKAPIIASELIVPTGQNLEINPLQERITEVAPGEIDADQANRGFQIKEHILLGSTGSPVSAIETPNSNFKIITPRFVVIHYTAGPGSAAAKWIVNPDSKASAHLIIDRDGKVTQLIPFDFVAWHAGVSEWKGISDLNQYSIAIMLENLGWLKKNADGQWVSSFGQTVSQDEVFVPIPENGQKELGWHTYTDEQISTLIEVLKALFAYYPQLEEVVGHDDIGEGKQDPGPAFPWERVFDELITE